VVRLLWSQEVDNGLYTDGYQGDEDQCSGHRLVAGVQVAAEGEEDGAHREYQHAWQHAPQYRAYKETGREQQTRSHVEIPQNMQRAMARQAESERERRAKIIAAEGEYQASQRLRQAADRLESPTALQLRLFQTMGEIAVNQNSTIILPIPLDLFRPFLESQNGSYGQGVEVARREEEKEAERLYQEAVGDATSEVSSEAVPTEMPDGEPKR
jgi:hypothetical protein